ncbi:MAG: cyclophilin-like fold protein [Clostridia bacterium]|nr:cyclophilin-like fold protein [Clostridia bacterium]
MKSKILLTVTLALALTALTSGCGRNKEITGIEPAENTVSENTVNMDSGEEINELNVSFGDDGTPFTMHLYDNDTAKTIAGFLGAGNLRLPIYHYDDYENWEVMQYYDIPARYEIPHNTETVTSEKAGEVYFAEPNRIVLFYGDAEVEGEFTRLGYFDYSEEFAAAVADNPVLEDWGNKIVVISK